VSSNIFPNLSISVPPCGHTISSHILRFFFYEKGQKAQSARLMQKSESSSSFNTVHSLINTAQEHGNEMSHNTLSNNTIQNVRTITSLAD